MTKTALPQMRVLGLPADLPVKRDPVRQTRTLVMPDGTRLLCRQRGDGWTAEVPLALAKDLFTED